MTTEELKQLITTTITADDNKTAIAGIVKAEMEKLSNELAGGKPTLGKSTDVKDVFDYVPQDIGHGYVQTKEGSILNLNNPQAPWVRVGETTKEWAKAFVQLYKTGVASEKLVSKDMTEGTDSAGGYLVPDEFRAMVVMSDMPGLVMWPGATVWPMKGQVLGIPKLVQDIEDNSFFSGVSFTWTSEGGEKTATQPVFDFITLTAYELSGYTALTDTLLDDSAVNLMNFLTNLFGKAWYWTTDKSFIQGSGSSQPLGIVKDDSVITVNRSTAGTVTVTDVLNMEAALSSVFDPGAVWLGSKSVRAALRGQKDDNGALILTESYQQFGKGAETRLLGYPFLLADGKVSSKGTTGDLILGNRSQYYVGDRKKFSMDVSKHYLFQNNKTALRVVGRLDGQAAIPDAFVILGTVSS
ncbi:MAG: phage major capsid protein [Candidatus Caldatribacteriota bacterium]|nr:phage major capsid protein [Candidatus Caldatribacteriota bacterium]